MNHSPLSKPAAIYARQSRGSRTELTSCEVQIDICKSAAAAQGWSLTRPYVDESESSETLDRPAMQELLSGIKARTVTRLVVDRLDRLTRRLVDLLVLLELFADYQVELVVVNDPNFSNSPTSRLMTHIVGAASEFQLDITRERMADARAALKRRGKRVAGRIPFGYQADPDTKALRPHPKEAIVVRDFFKLAAEGSRPSELATLANLQGWENHAGETGRWTSRGITKLLSNPIYTGRIHNGTETLPGEHDSIVNQETFDEVQRQIASRQTRSFETGERKAKPERDTPLLRGLLICGHCDRPMGTSISQNGSIRYPYYRCRSTAGGRPPCAGVNVHCHEIETLIITILGQPNASDPDEMAGIAEAWNKLDEAIQRKLLPTILRRVVWHHADQEITLDLMDDAAERIAIATGAESE
jgi:site-specific DNA recombinase